MFSSRITALGLWRLSSSFFGAWPGFGAGTRGRGIGYSIVLLHEWFFGENKEIIFICKSTKFPSVSLSLVDARKLHNIQ